MAQTSKKDVIYIDSDDEITTIIDKVTSSELKITALVLPKRLPALQSIVNMKLLKQSALKSKKSLVLITSSHHVMPFAGAVGVHVAKTLQSKPEIPDPPKIPTSNESISASGEEAVVAAGATKTVGELNDAKKSANEDEVQLSDEKAPVATKKSKKGKKDFKIPNFNAFRIKLALGALLLLLLIIGWIYAFVIAPTAEIVVRTNTDTINTTVELTADTTLEDIDAEAKAIPAVQVASEKTDAETVNATGEKNVGKQATGEVVLQNCRQSAGKVTIPAGTGVSSGNLTFITSTAVELPESSFNFAGGCKTDAEEVVVVAQSAGKDYNLDAGSSFTVAGYSNINGENEEDITGGTDEIVKVVQQSDIDAAKQAVLDRLNEDVKEKLIEENTNGDTVVLRETFKRSEPIVATNHEVDDESDTVTVTVKSTLSLLTISLDHLALFIEESVQTQIDPSQQSILDNGLQAATIEASEVTSGNQASINVSAVVTAGPELSEDTVKNEVIGRKKGEAIQALESRPGVDQVDINYSPFWVYSTPSNQNKITVVFNQSNAATE